MYVTETALQIKLVLDADLTQAASAQAVNCWRLAGQGTQDKGAQVLLKDIAVQPVEVTLNVGPGLTSASLVLGHVVLMCNSWSLLDHPTGMTSLPVLQNTVQCEPCDSPLCVYTSPC